MTFRVTQSMLNSDMLRNLSKSYKALGKYQDQLSSGKKINKPSDDPVVAVRGMFHRTTLMEIEQFKRNADEARSWMELTDSALGEANDILQRIRELTIQASNDTYAQSSLDATAEEIEQLKVQLGEVANTTFAGRYIFAGTKTKTAPYREDPNTNEMAFLSQNTEDITLEINKNSFVKVNVNGIDVFKYDDGTHPGVFESIDQIIEDLRNGNNPGGNLDSLDIQMDHILSERAALGARVNRIELSMSRLDESEYMTNKLLSQEEDADIAKVITELKAQENVHRAALSAGARIIQPTLVDFLR